LLEHCFFKILPQLLSDLGELKLDWSNLCIYTCPNSCGGHEQFYEEHMHWQEPHQPLGPIDLGDRRLDKHSIIKT
jgi:hypothetical protein